MEICRCLESSEHSHKSNMKTAKKVSVVMVAFLLITIAFSACKKGSDDPVVSLKTRKDRFTNTWTLVRYEKNGASQDISGSTYVYAVSNNQTLTRTVEGSIFGFPIRNISNGTWTFLNDDEDVQIAFGSSTTIYAIQRLASKELWLKENSGSDTYTYYFVGN